MEEEMIIIGASAAAVLIVLYLLAGSSTAVVKPPQAPTAYGLSVSVLDQSTSSTIPNATVSIPSIGTQVTTSSGSVSFSNVPAGTYTATVSASGYTVATQQFTIPDANLNKSNGVDMETVYLSKETVSPGTGNSYGYLQVTVLNTLGNPVPGASVIVGNQYTGVTNSAGFVAIGNIPGGTYNVQASAIGYIIQGTTINITSGAIAGTVMSAIPVANSVPPSSISPQVTLTPSNFSMTNGSLLVVSGTGFTPGGVVQVGMSASNTVTNNLSGQLTANSQGSFTFSAQYENTSTYTSTLAYLLSKSSGNSMYINVKDFATGDIASATLYF